MEMIFCFGRIYDVQLLRRWRRGFLMFSLLCCGFSDEEIGGSVVVERDLVKERGNRMCFLLCGCGAE